jgi:predicted O-methyltransferase YrrM
MNITTNKRVELAKRYNLMSNTERDFLLSLIEQVKPKNIIEIGVYAGGATHFIYEATRESGAKILSVDIMDNQGDSFQMPTGFVMEGIDDPRFRREYGKDVSEVCDAFDKTGEKFDFLILDTAHVHPIESLNFLTIFPYLTEDATVVLHDISLFTENESTLACKLLFDTITGDKLELIENPNYYFANIGAFKLNTDTRKYIRDVFSMLRFPWIMFPARLNHIWDVIKRHYDDECIKLFQSAFVYNAWKLSNSEGENLLLKLVLNSDAIRSKLKKYNKIIFWGFGPNTYSSELMFLFKMLNFPLPCEIWDRNFKLYQSESILKPTQPILEKLGVNDCVIAIAKSSWTNDSIISNIIKADCENFFTLNDLISLM